MGLWNRLVNFLTDDSAARENMRDVEEILREITTVSRGDGDFDKILCAVLDNRSPGSSIYRAPRFKGFLRQSYDMVKQHYPSGPNPDSWFVVAQRVRENLPIIYGLSCEEPRSTR